VTVNKKKDKIMIKEIKNMEAQEINKKTDKEKDKDKDKKIDKNNVNVKEIEKIKKIVKITILEDKEIDDNNQIITLFIKN
jgi:hypothetical protein